MPTVKWENVPRQVLTQDIGHRLGYVSAAS